MLREKQMTVKVQTRGCRQALTPAAFPSPLAQALGPVCFSPRAGCSGCRIARSLGRRGISPESPILSPLLLSCEVALRREGRKSHSLHGGFLAI